VLSVRPARAVARGAAELAVALCWPSAPQRGGRGTAATPAKVAVDPLHRLRGSTLGIFRPDKYRQPVAAAGRGLGMKVLVWGREKSLAEARAAGYEPPPAKAELSSGADCVAASRAAAAGTARQSSPAEDLRG